MRILDKIIDRFFDRIKNKQTENINRLIRKERPELAKKLDKIDKSYKELEDFLNSKKD